jgi:tetratricopeptide (TPR) repeat protein
LVSFRWQSFLPLSLFCVLLCAGSLSAQSADGNTLIGKVRTESGRPLANVLVELQTGNGVLITQTVTTNEGDYAFTSLTGASFVIVVNEPDHKPFAERVELTRTATTRPGEMVRIDLVLSPREHPPTPRADTIFHQDVPEAALRAYRLGLRWLAERKSNEGIAALNKAVAILPKYFDARLALGLEYFRLHRLSDAIQELELARAVNPRDARLYNTFGLVLYEQKKFDTAAIVLEAAERLNPTSAQTHLMRGAALIETGRLNEAEEEIVRADQISGHKLSLVHLHVARIYEKRGDRIRAADELETYLRQNPSAENAPAIREAIKKLKSR